MKNQEYFMVPKRKALAFLSLALIMVFGVVAAVGFQDKPSSFHIEAYVTRADGTVEYLGYHAGSLTLLGKNWIEGIMGNKNFVNATDFAIYGSLSTSADAFDDAWVQIPAEITTDGLERAEMTYASTGDGVWTLTKQWTASGTHTNVQRVGINHIATPNGGLVWADTITPVTLNSADKLTIVATTTVSG